MPLAVTMTIIRLHASSVPSMILRLLPFLAIVVMLLVLRLVIMNDQIHRDSHARHPKPEAPGNDSRHPEPEKETLALDHGLVQRRADNLYIDDVDIKEKHHDDDHEDDEVYNNDEEDDDDDEVQHQLVRLAR